MFNLDFLRRSSLIGTIWRASPSNDMPFQQLIIYVLQCPHDVDVRFLFYIDLDLHLNCFQGPV